MTRYIESLSGIPLPKMEMNEAVKYCRKHGYEDLAKGIEAEIQRLQEEDKADEQEEQEEHKYDQDLLNGSE